MNIQGCLPGDITEQIRLLEKYRASVFDLVTAVPQHVHFALDILVTI
jgi:hypothetical protein